jgi:hypothetical protein
LYTKYSKTFRGRLDRFFQKAGIAAVIGAVVMVLLVIMVGASLIGFYVLRPKATADQAATVNTIVNTSFTVSPDEPVSFRIVIPKGAKNSRAVGVFKVTSGTAVNVYIVSEEQFAQWATGTARPAIALREESHSAKLRQPLVSGSYYLLFASPNADAVTVAAEFYSKYD